MQPSQKSKKEWNSNKRGERKEERGERREERGKQNQKIKKSKNQKIKNIPTFATVITGGVMRHADAQRYLRTRAV
jgi:hypothetical protein